MTLGSNQLGALQMMAGAPWAGWCEVRGGFVLDSHSNTDRVMRSLVKHGLVTVVVENVGSGYGRYELNYEEAIKIPEVSDYLRRLFTLDCYRQGAAWDRWSDSLTPPRA